NEDKLHVMADALIRYETIDENQIKDIMEGREPRPPSDWDESGSAPAEAGPPKTDKGKDADSPIGGPASQH
ncbi:MAG: ATP-dependent metalloprotease, partial [Gammaproteobacteria bacterium]